MMGGADMFEPGVAESDLALTLSDLDGVLKDEKGWVRYDNQGHEYVYEYCVKNSDIRIKVLSGVSVRSQEMDVPGLDCIRVFAILYSEASGNRKKSVKGLCPARKVMPGGDWKTRLKRVYEETLKDALRKAPRVVPLIGNRHR